MQIGFAGKTAIDYRYCSEFDEYKSEFKAI